MNKYQEALNKIIRSCCPYCYDDNGCQNCKIKQTCNATAKSWVDTLQELVDKETPMKTVGVSMNGMGYGFCERCGSGIHLAQHYDEKEIEHYEAIIKRWGEKYHLLEKELLQTKKNF